MLAQARKAKGNRSQLLEFCMYFEGRFFEFATSLILIGMAIHLQTWPQSVAASSFHELVHHINPNLLGFFFGIFGGLRLSALIANGMWPSVGPWLRATGAFFGALVFANMAAALYQGDAAVFASPSPAIPVYIVLALFELLSVYKALARVTHGISK